MKVTKPRKAEGAMTNTWIVDIDGFENIYGEGIDESLFRSKQKVITVRFTSDKYGESLSFTDEPNNRQWIVPFKKIEEMVELARKVYKKN